jgi:hypothetical protein
MQLRPMIGGKSAQPNSTLILIIASGNTTTPKPVIFIDTAETLAVPNER